jgi:UDP:flavonoid glycosyltransferase YjiC (YdhE family)
MAHDQLDNLSRVRELGVGDGLHPRQFKAKRIAAMLARLLRDPAMKARAVEVSKRFDPAGWMEQTCRLVEALDPKLTSAP